MDSKIEMNDSHSRELSKKQKKLNTESKTLNGTYKIHSTATTYG